MVHSATWLDSTGLVGWCFLIATGLTGFVVDYSRPVPKTEPPPPPPAQAIDVDLSLSASPDNDDSNDPPPAVPSDEPLPPPLPNMPPSSAPELLSVADPSTVEFALPVEGPARTVSAARASHEGRIGKGNDSDTGRYGGPVETLVFGKGDGAQPAPRYPWKAVKEGQEGRVGVVFCVGKQGYVVSGEVSRPCPWPLLNESALRTVLHRWRFSPGELRYYEVTIQFELEK